MTINSATITESAGVSITQGANSGTLKTDLTGAGTVTVVILCASGVTFDTNTDIVVGSYTINNGDVTNAVHSGAITSVLINTASTITLDSTTSLSIGSDTIPAPAITNAANTGAVTTVVVLTATGITLDTSTNLVVGSHTIVSGDVTGAVNTGSTTSIVVNVASGVVLDALTDLAIGSYTVLAADITNAVNSGAITSLTITTPIGHTITTGHDLLVGSTTVAHGDIISVSSTTTAAAVCSYGAQANYNPSQVKGYTWIVEFNSNIHDGSDSQTAVWNSPPASGTEYSTAWGRNIGDQPNLQCETLNLKTESDGETQTCIINSGQNDPARDMQHIHQDGSEPLKGTFKITFDTTNCYTCDVRAIYTTEPIRHNAKATRGDSNGDLTSIEERLEALPNVGDIIVSRGAVNITTGGYVWTITFMRDADGSSGACIASDGSESTGCQSPGNVPALQPVQVGVGFGGTNAIITNFEVAKGNILRGFFKLRMSSFMNGHGDGTQLTTALPWNADVTSVKTALDALPSLIAVDVTRVRVGKFGAYTWNVTYTENHDQHPPGTGDLPDMVIDSGLLNESNAGTSRTFTVTELQKGSDGLSGTFQINFKNAVSGYRTFVYNNTDTDMELQLEGIFGDPSNNGLETISDIHITREIHGAGWNHIPVALPVEPQAGGYKWKITFVRNYGEYEGETFPPGSGDVPSFQWINNLGGHLPTVSINETVKGSTSLGGMFNLSYSGATTSLLPYSVTAASVETALDALVLQKATGNVSVERDFSATMQLPGYVQAEPGRNYIKLTNLSGFDVTSKLSRGDVIRIGGGTGDVSTTAYGGGPLGLNGTNGDTLIGYASVADNSTAMKTSVDIRTKLFLGHKVRLRGKVHEIKKWDTEVHQVVISAGYMTWTITVGAQTVTEVADVVVTQGSYSGTLSAGATSASVITIRSPIGTVFDLSADIMVGSTNILQANIVSATSTTTESTVFLNTGGPSNVGTGLSGSCANLITDPANPLTTITQGSGISTIVSNNIGDGRDYVIDPPFKGFDAADVKIYRIAELFTIANTGTFDSTTIPLAKISNDKDQQGVTIDSFIGPFSNQFRLYKVDGHVYTVHFDTNLGNLVPMTTGYDDLVGTNATVYTTDDVVKGELPTSYSVTSLKQGVPYHFRVKVKTNLGWSQYSSPSAVQAPMQAPEPPSFTSAGYAAHVDEIQTITTVATHVDEIQTITTTAINVDEIQTVTTTAPIGSSVDGNFSLRYENFATHQEIQEIRFTSRNSPIEWGTFRITYTDAATSTPVTTSAACMEINATKETVQAELRGLSNLPNVSVWRSVVENNQNGGSDIVYTFGFDDTSYTYGDTAQDNLKHHELAVSTTGCYSMYGGDNHTITVTTISQGGVDIPHDAEALFLQRELEILPNVGKTFVTRSLADDQGGFMYSITMLDLQRDVRGLSCETNTIFRAVTGAKCSVKTLLDGNQIGGFFTLTYNGQTTGGIQHDASASDMATSLTALDKIQSLVVRRSELPDKEGGYVWTVQFTTNMGDLGLITSTSSLTGTSALITIKEVQKGNWLSGTFTMSHGGKTTHPIPYDASATLFSEELTKISTVDQVSVTRTSTPDMQRGYTWTVTFLADTMQGDIPLLTSNTDSLMAVGKNVFVREQRIGSEAIGTDIHVSFGVPASDGGSPVTYYKIEYDTTSSFASGGLRSTTIKDAANLFEVQKLLLTTSTSLTGESYRLNYGTGASSRTSISTSPAISGIADKYQLRDALEKIPGIDAVNIVPEYDSLDSRRLTGQSYTITFTSMTADGQSGLSAVQMLGSPESDHLVDTMSHHTSYHTSDVRVSGMDCISCTYLKDLTMGAKYYVRSRACNQVGCSTPTTMNSSVIPRQLPSAPNSAKLYVVSGTELEVFFNPPSNIGGAVVTSYLVEWDTVSSFNSKGIGQALGQAVVSGGAIAGSPPFSKVIGTSFPLNTSTPYFVRVAAANDVSVQQVSPTQTPPDNRNWETTTPLYAVPMNRPPNPPDSVELSLLHGTSLRVLIKPPTRMGGVAVTKYKVEYSTVSTFTPPTTAATDVSVLSMSTLAVSGRHVYDIPNLTSGQVYYVRVSAYNGVHYENSNGYGSPRLSTPSFTIPSETPSGPTTVKIQTITKQATPIRHVDVQWMSPTSNGGSEITAYKVEWWTKLVEYEVQSIHVSNSVPGDHNGTFLVNCV
jgi:hypothetical protein